MEYRNRVMQVTQSSGSGALEFVATVPGYNSFFEAFGNDAPFYYCIDAGSSYEIGKGHVVGGTLYRDQVLESTTGGLLNLVGGVDVKVFATVPAQRLSNFLWDRLDNAILGATAEALKAINVTPGTPPTLDLRTARVFHLKAVASTSFAITNAGAIGGDSTIAAAVYVYIENMYSQPITITPPTGWKWGASYTGAQSITIAAGSTCGLSAVTLDKGQTWLGGILGRGW